jgi:hypothetical protein
MRRIAAAENLLIDMESNRWRLLSNPNGDPNSIKVVVEAAAGEPLRYVPGFASTRRLPKNGTLPVEYIREVVLGWSNTDEAWHLGLLLGRDLAEARGSRWCEIAHWPDPDLNVFADLAREAGESLAQALNRPFDLIPPRPRAVEPEAPPRPLPALPVGEAALLEFTRSSSWTTSKIVRIVWYGFWVAVYVLLSVTTLNTDLALPNAGTMLPNPQLLPYLGLGAAVVLTLMILYTLFELLTHANRIVIDPQRRVVEALRGSRPRWTLSTDDVQSIYVTQVVSKRGKKRTVFHGEMNLHLGGGAFKRLLQQTEQEEFTVPEDEPSAQEGITPLTRDAAVTNLQIGGLYVAEALGRLPSWYDQRVR